MNKQKILIWVLILIGTAFLLSSAGRYYQSFQEGQLAEQNAQRLLSYYQQPPSNPETEGLPENDTDKPHTLLIPDKYPIIGILSLDSINVQVPVIDRFTDELLKVSVCRYEGPADPKEDGNIVISGHNYRNGAHFGKLKKIKQGDVVRLTNLDQVDYSYEVVELETVAATAIEAVQNTLSKQALTLFTCNEKGDKRLIVRCKLIEK